MKPSPEQSVGLEELERELHGSGPDVAVGVPKAVAPMFCGTRQGVPAIPQTAADV